MIDSETGNEFVNMARGTFPYPCFPCLQSGLRTAQIWHEGLSPTLVYSLKA